jgi:excinuclease ABC subunit B
MGVKVHYLHSEVETLERIEILRDLRLGVYDVIVGVNLLREGIDLPEVTLVAILDADKEGYLRSKGSLIQVIGRAARHLEGTVIMYADRVTDSMRHAIDETERRRAIQLTWNTEHGVEPTSIVKAIRDIGIRLRSVAEEGEQREKTVFRAKDMSRDELVRLVKDLETQMKQAARDLDFEQAAMLRDEIVDLRGLLVLEQSSPEIRTLEQMAGTTTGDGARTKRVIRGRRGRR